MAEPEQRLESSSYLQTFWCRFVVFVLSNGYQVFCSLSLQIFLMNLLCKSERVRLENFQKIIRFCNLKFKGLERIRVNLLD